MTDAPPTHSRPTRAQMNSIALRASRRLGTFIELDYKASEGGYWVLPYDNPFLTPPPARRDAYSAYDFLNALIAQTATTGDTHMADMATQKRTVEEIVEDLDGISSMALAIHGIQVDASNFTEGFRDPNKPGRPVMWDIVDYHGIDRDLFGLLMQIAECEVRL